MGKAGKASSRLAAFDGLVGACELALDVQRGVVVDHDVLLVLALLVGKAGNEVVVDLDGGWREEPEPENTLEDCSTLDLRD